MQSQIQNENRNYINTKVNGILENMLKDILISKPEEVTQFMIKWLQEKGGKVEQNLKKKQEFSNRNAYGESSEDDDYEDAEDLPSKEELQRKSMSKPGRISVSAEAYGQFNKKSAYKPKVIPKTQNQKERIKERLLQAFMFSALEPKDLEIVLNAMEEKHFSAGQKIINQGEDGDNLYVVDNGTLECFKSFSKGAEPKYLKTYGPGEAFGELALLYNAPRAATVIAQSDVQLFALDRDCFNHIVKEAAAKKREKYESFLGRVELLDTMDPYERSKIADALQSMKFKKGDYVVKEGETGDNFFFVEDGEAIATKILQPGKAPEIVYKYKSGDYFGELALLRQTPRAANIIAQTDLSLVVLNRMSFKRLLGPLDDILKRNFARYEKFVA